MTNQIQNHKVAVRTHPVLNSFVTFQVTKFNYSIATCGSLEKFYLRDD